MGLEPHDEAQDGLAWLGHGAEAAAEHGDETLHFTGGGKVVQSDSEGGVGVGLGLTEQGLYVIGEEGVVVKREEVTTVLGINTAEEGALLHLETSEGYDLLFLSTPETVAAFIHHFTEHVLPIPPDTTTLASLSLPPAVVTTLGFTSTADTQQQEEDPVAALERQRRERLEAEHHQQLEAERQLALEKELLKEKIEEDKKQTDRKATAAMRRLSIRRRTAVTVGRHLTKEKPEWWTGPWPPPDLLTLPEEELVSIKAALDSHLGEVGSPLGDVAQELPQEPKAAEMHEQTEEENIPEKVDEMCTEEQQADERTAEQQRETEQVQEEDRITEVREAEELRAAEERKAEKQRIEEQRKQEQAEEERRAEEVRITEEQQKAEAERLKVEEVEKERLEEARIAEEARQREEQREEEERELAEARKAEQRRKDEQALEEQRKAEAEEQRKAEEQRREAEAEERQKAERQQREAEEQHKAEEQRRERQQREAEELQRKAEEQQSAEEQQREAEEQRKAEVEKQEEQSAEEREMAAHIAQEQAAEKLKAAEEQRRVEELRLAAEQVEAERIAEAQKAEELRNEQIAEERRAERERIAREARAAEEKRIAEEERELQEQYRANSVYTEPTQSTERAVKDELMSQLLQEEEEKEAMLKHAEELAAFEVRTMRARQEVATPERRTVSEAPETPMNVKFQEVLAGVECDEVVRRAAVVAGWERGMPVLGGAETHSPRVHEGSDRLEKRLVTKRQAACAREDWEEVRRLDLVMQAVKGTDAVPREAPNRGTHFMLQGAQGWLDYRESDQARPADIKQCAAAWLDVLQSHEKRGEPRYPTGGRSVEVQKRLARYKLRKARKELEG